MAISISSLLQGALNDYERYGAVLFTMQFGTGTHGLWTGPGEIPFNGLIYRAGGSLLEIDDIQTMADGSVAECTVSLSTSPEKGLTADVLSTFYLEDWHMRPVTIQLAMCDPNTFIPLGVVTIIDGLLYQAPTKKGEDESSIKGRIVSHAIKMSESGNKYRNESMQRQIDPTDTALVGIGTLNGYVTRDLKWGQA